MRYSSLFIATFKESPKDAEVISHQLMIRAGFIRKVGAGIYSYTPLGLKIIRKFEAIVREEMNKAGAQEVLLPNVVPAQLWQQSGRWEKYGKELLRLTDRHDNAFCFGPTHEEVITELAKGFIKSYRQLPVNLYQIQTKFRDEIRPRFGLMRGREFIMKDAYSFHKNAQELDKTYEDMRKAYTQIFSRCGLNFKMVQADSGSIGGSFSAEFMVTADTGEDAILECTQCDYAANVEAAESIPVSSLSPTSQSYEEVVTPGKKTIADVASFLNQPADHFIKTLVYLADGKPVAVLVRGDFDINDIKLKKVLQVETLALMKEADVETLTGVPVGFLGPVGLSLPLIIDHSVMSVSDGVTGANKKDIHFTHVVPGSDFSVPKTEDIRVVTAGDSCPSCLQRGVSSPLRVIRGIEVGHIFKLGTTYSEKMEASFLDENGKSLPMIMGCYGIGIGRTVAAAIEQNHDEKGIVWPKALAPFEVVILLTSLSDPDLVEAAETLYNRLKEKNIDVLLDDRTDSVGAKFKDAELLGIPYQIVVGKLYKQEQKVELKSRKTGAVQHSALSDVEGQLSREF
jgi:prolyl-tRNA synthetase